METYADTFVCTHVHMCIYIYIHTRLITIQKIIEDYNKKIMKFGFQY